MAFPPPAKVAKGLCVSFVTTLLLLGGAETLLRASGYAESPAMYFDPEVGLRYFPNQTRRMLRGDDDLGEVTTNEWGFRSRSFKRVKRPGTFRLVCLGDSFTLGWGVSDQETWPHLLQEACDQRYGAQRVEVINLGQPDFNTVNELRLYRSLVRTMDPDLVILAYVQNDLAPETLGPVSKVARFDQWVGSSAIMRAVRVHLYENLGVYQFAHGSQNQGRRKRYLELKDTIHHDPLNEVATEYWEESMGALSSLANETKEDGVPLLLAVFPLRSQIEPGARVVSMAGKGIPRYQTRLQTAANVLGVPMLDLRLPFIAVGTDAYAEYDSFHPGAKGMEVTARELDRKIAELGFVHAGGSAGAKASPQEQ